MRARDPGARSRRPLRARVAGLHAAAALRVLRPRLRLPGSGYGSDLPARIVGGHDERWQGSSAEQDEVGSVRPGERVPEGHCHLGAPPYLARHAPPSTRRRARLDRAVPPRRASSTASRLRSCATRPAASTRCRTSSPPSATRPRSRPSARASFSTLSRSPPSS